MMWLIDPGCVRVASKQVALSRSAQNEAAQQVAYVRVPVAAVAGGSIHGKARRWYASSGGKKSAVDASLAHRSTACAIVPL